MKVELSDTIILRSLDAKNKKWRFKVEEGANFSTHLGQITTENLIGKKYGTVVPLSNGSVIILPLTPRNFVRTFRLQTNIMYEDDCAMVLSLANISSGCIVGESGTGSGGLTSFIAYQVKPTGKVYTFDNNEKHLEVARKNLESVNLAKYIEFFKHDIREKIDIEPLDAFILDFSTPWEAIPTITEILKDSGKLIVFVPNWNQVELTVESINENDSLILENVLEITRRDFVVKPSVMRPRTRNIVYSGILIEATKIIP